MSTGAGLVELAPDFIALLLLVVQIFSAAQLIPYPALGFALRWGMFAYLCLRILPFRRRIHLLLLTVSPFLPLLLISVFAAMAGYAPVRSFSVLGFFFMTAAVAVCCSCLGRTVSYRIVLICAAGAMVVGALAAFFDPDLAAEVYGGGWVWKGLSPSKNIFGGLAAALLVAALAFPAIQSSLRFLAGLAALICVAGSGSITAAASASAGLAFFALLKLQLRLRLSRFLAALSTMLLLAAAIVALLALSSDLAQVFGRDLSMTGRTEIWRAYLESMQDHLLLGQGPSAYDLPNDITDRLAQAHDFGADKITTPHNLYIAMLGDTGLYGLVALVVALLYVIMIVPFDRRPSSAAAAAFAVALSVHGLAEITSPFAFDFFWFLLLLCRANTLLHERGGESYGRTAMQPLAETRRV